MLVGIGVNQHTCVSQMCKTGAEAIAKRIGAVSYTSYSSLTVDNTFEVAECLMIEPV